MQINKSNVIYISILSIVLILAVYYKLDRFVLMPGDIGDARLNNYFLENIYNYFFGGVESLWHLNFFYPYPYLIGFSDNLFGSAPIYIAARYLTGEPDTAFQVWFAIGYFLNFVGCFFSLRMLSIPTASSILGALVFTLALPTSSHANHVQLHYRFASALSISYAVIYSYQREHKFVLFSFFWLVFQYYCGIYIGFFTTLFDCLLITFSLAFLSSGKWNLHYNFRKFHFLRNFMFFSLLILAIIFLFYPYYIVQNLYGIKREWFEISNMLPRIESYFYSNSSPIWKYVSNLLPEVPMVGEHQMFVGVVPFLLLIFSAFLIRKSTLWPNLKILFYVSLVVIVTSLSFYGFSLWFFIYKAPLFSAIRAVTRLDQVLLFPVAVFCALGIEEIFKNRHKLKLAAILVSCVVLFAEWITVPYASTSAKSEWRSRLKSVEDILPNSLSDKDILFIAQRNGPFFADEIDVMWVAAKYNLKTINGYTGSSPTGFEIDFKNNCEEIISRIQHVAAFKAMHPDLTLGADSERRLRLIGFDHCR